MNGNNSDSDWEWSDSDSEDIKQNQDKTPFAILSSESLKESMNTIINEVKMIACDLRDDVIRVFLSHYKWDKERFIEDYYSIDLEDLYRKVGLYDFSNSNKVSCTQQDCEICLESSPFNKNLWLGCPHKICLSCWFEYLQHKIINEKEKNNIYCPGHDCKYVLRENVVAYVLQEQYAIAQSNNDDVTIKSIDQLEKDSVRLLCKSYVEDKLYMKWCCNYKSNCNNAIILNRNYNEDLALSDYLADLNGSYLVRRIDCSCGYSFCFDCEMVWHGPIPCKLMTEWHDRIHSNVETKKYLQSYTKPCPNCNHAIEKNDGCNRIVCGSCKFEFCWLCSCEWKVHGYGICNEMKEKDGQVQGGFGTEKENPEKEAMQADLKHYHFYFDRYNNHLKGVGIYEKNLKENVKLFISFMLGETERYILDEVLRENIAVHVNDEATIAIDWLSFNDVIKEIHNCRVILCCTYAFAYYLDPQSNNSKLFASNQVFLEQIVEDIAQKLEDKLLFQTVLMSNELSYPRSIVKVDHIKLNKLRHECISAKNNMVKRRKILEDTICQGFQNKEFKFLKHCPYH